MKRTDLIKLITTTIFELFVIGCVIVYFAFPQRPREIYGEAGYWGIAVYIISSTIFNGIMLIKCAINCFKHRARGN